MPLILSDYRHFPPSLRSGVLCVGNFDGVHLGHARMLAAGRHEAQRRGASFTIMTFDPHPAVILRPIVRRIPLTIAEQRLRLLGAFNPDALVIIPTSREFLAITPQEFLHDVVHEILSARLMVEGPTFTYGKGARGTIETLRHDGPKHAIELLLVPTQEASLSDLTLVNVSSSLIRWLIEHGRVKDAAACLGRPYALSGTVIHGQERGKALGFPTANIAPAQLLPAAGIYAGAASLADGRTFKAAISIGDNPTFHAGHITIEAHLLDFSEDIYGQPLELHFHRWLREMLPFAGAQPLVRQMQRDIEEVRRL